MCICGTPVSLDARPPLPNGFRKPLYIASPPSGSCQRCETRDTPVPLIWEPRMKGNRPRMRRNCLSDLERLSCQQTAANKHQMHARHHRLVCPADFARAYDQIIIIQWQDQCMIERPFQNTCRVTHRPPCLFRGERLRQRRLTIPDASQRLRSTLCIIHG